MCTGRHGDHLAEALEGGLRAQAGTLVNVFPEYSQATALDKAAAWLLYPSRTYVLLKVQAFVAFLREQFRHGPRGDHPGFG